MAGSHLIHKVLICAAVAAIHAGCASGGDATQAAAGSGTGGSAGVSDAATTDTPAESAAGAAQGDAQSEASPDVSTDDAPADTEQETSTTDGATTEAGPDQSSPETGYDAPAGWDAPPEGIVCGTNVCSGPDVCCAIPDGVGGVTMSCLQTCPDGGATLSCDGPEDCVGSGTYCCASIHVGAGSPPTCPLDMASASCTNSCATNIPSTCPNDGQVRLCHLSAECDIQDYCCRFVQAGTSVTFCVPQLMTMLAEECY